MFKKNKLSGAIKLALATTMVFSLSGCLIEGSESVSTSGGSVTQVTNPTGTVIGHVQDTNGNPLAGVSIYLAGATATTDAGGNYSFADVGVINAASANEDTGHSPLSITIAAPDGYLGSTVTVSPNAQIDGVQTDAALDSTATVFVDGFLAQAGTAVLPALSSSVSGVLRDDSTEEAIGGMVIRLDLEDAGTGDSDQQQGHDGVDSSFATSTYTTTTAADGSFSFIGLPDDSEMRFMIEGYDTGGATVSTEDESVFFYGNLFASKILAIDTENPYVTSVDGAMDDNPTGILNDDITGVAGSDIVINFSETIDSTLIDANSVVVWDDANGYQTTATAALATDGMSMTVTTPAAIDPGAIVHIFLLVPDFADSSGNVLTTAAAVDYDSDRSADSGAQYVRLALLVFSEANLDAPAVITLHQQFEDTLGDDDDEAVQSSNSVFMDVDDFTVGFQQLNSADDDDSNGNDAAERLSDLSTELGAGAVETDVARIGFTPTGAASYVLEVQDGSGVTLDPDAGDYAIADSSSNVTVTGDSPTEIFFTVDDLNDVFAISDSMEPGYTVILTPVDDLGHRGTSQSQVLADQVEPTTIVQNSYGVGPSNDAVVTSFDFGDGGQQASVGAQTIGTPYLNITPQLLDNLDSAGDDKSIVGVNNDDDSLIYELHEFNTVDATNCNVDTPCVDPASGIYDATAYAAMDVARRMSVAMSEDGELTGTDPAYSGTAGVLSNWAVHNDVTVSDETVVPTTVNADLVDMDVSNVFTLAADDGSDIDYTGALQDTATIPNVAGTLADANPRVVVRDAMPPMVTSAIYSGTDIVINFNEAVVPTTAASISIGTITFNLSQETVDAHVAGSATLTIPATDANWIADSGSTGNYGWLEVGVDNLAVWEYDDGAGAGVAYHGVLDTASIEDANENNWDADSAGITVPYFAYASTVDTLFGLTEGSTDADWTAAGVATVNTLLTFTFTGTHAIDMSSLGVAADATGMTAAEIDAAFAFGGGATSTIGANSIASLSLNRKTLTVTIEVFTADLNPTETFGPLADITSDFDGSQSELSADMQLTKP